MAKRTRRLFSVKRELLLKSRESALTAVQVFNNPNIQFKSESYIVLMVIAWTYLMHAYYRGAGVEYRYFKQQGKRRRFDRTKHGAFKHWELERCLNDDRCPLDKDAANNLRFLIGLRHEIEHQMTTGIDDLLTARFQACCINYNTAIKEMFGPEFGIDQHLSVSLQFARMSEEQIDQLGEHPGLPAYVQSYIEGFDGTLSDAEFNSERFAYRVLFVAKLANRKGQADRVIEFVKSGTALADKVNAEYVVVKETERKKWLPSQIVEQMKAEGFKRFNMHHHTTLWQQKDAKNQAHGFGTPVAKAWYWYDRWVDVVRSHCKDNGEAYR